MAKTQEENKRPAKKSSRRVNGVIITMIFFFLDLLLLGAFGKAGLVFTNFFVGVFGYAIYGYSFALTLLGVFYIFNLKARQSKKLIFIYALITITTITFAHILGSHNYALSGWGNYISLSYSRANTAGGALASIFLYLFATKYIYILALVANGIFTVGLIAISVLLQVNIDINLVPKRVKRARGVRGVSHSNINVYDVGNEQGGPSLNNQTVKGRNLGERLFRRGGRNRLEDYQPIDSLNISNDSVFENLGGVDFGAEYTPSYPQEEPQLILDTQEIRNEVNRNEYIYASEDVASVDNVTIASVQREYFGIDGSQRLPVVNEGANEAAPESNQPTPPQMTQRERTQSIYERFQSDSHTSSGYMDNGRTPSYYSQFHQADNSDKKNERFSSQNRQVQNSNQSPDYTGNSQQQLSFSERLSRLLDSSDELMDLGSIDFPPAAKEKKQYRSESENSDNAVVEDKKKDAQSSGDNIEDRNKIEDTNSIGDRNSVEDIKKVEDKTQRRREESIDEFIARTNREKQANESSPVRNYNVNEDAKSDKPVENSDGYFQKTYDKPKPLVEKKQSQNLSVSDNNKQQPSREEKKKIVRQPYVLPSIDNLKDYIPEVDDNEDYMERTKIIERTYANFGIEVHVKNIVSGPSVTRYEFEIPETLSVDKIPSKLNNILMALAVETARIEAPIPGKSLCGIELPNKIPKIVGLKEFITSDQFRNKRGGLYFALGKDIDNNCHYEDLTEFPHGLIAGGTGSGKSVCLNTMLCSLIYKYSPEELRIILVDPKSVEFSKYKGLPHLLTPKIYTTSQEALGILKWLCAEMDRRYALFSKYGITKITSYNSTPEVIEEGETIPYIVTIIDEVGDIMTSPEAKEFENYILRLAQKARAAGIHLILATQRPSVDIITGTIKANLPTRIAFAVTSSSDSRVILDSIGAEDLLGKGDMLIKTTRSRYMKRLQNPFIDDREIKNVVKDIASHNDAYYDETIEAEIASVSEPKKDESKKVIEKIKEYDFPDDLCPDVLKRIVGIDNVSISWMQRAFSIGFSRGGKIFDWLTNCGYIEKQGSKCICLLSAEQVDQIIQNARLGSEEQDDI